MAGMLYVDSLKQHDYRSDSSLERESWNLRHVKLENSTALRYKRDNFIATINDSRTSLPLAVGCYIDKAVQASLANQNSKILT